MSVKLVHKVIIWTYVICKSFSFNDPFLAQFQSRSQSPRYPCPAERENKIRLSSAFHWPLTERAQFDRKLINNNFVPRFPILSCARWKCKLWVRSLRARTWRTKQSLLRHINQQHVRRCCNFSFVSNRNDLFGAYLRVRTFRVLHCEGNRF